MLVVDDNPAAREAFGDGLRQLGALARVRHPNDVEIGDLLWADLVVVDFVLNHWDERAAQPVALAPAHGRALIEVFRSHLETESRPTAFAVDTSQFAELKTLLPPPTSKHAYARAYDFEWLFEKSEPDLNERVVELASTVRRLPEVWGVNADDPLGPARGLLALPDNEPWVVNASDHVNRCHPPLNELSQASHGLAFVRWLLHRILPYPCFLYGRPRLAARLGVPLDIVHELLSRPASRDSLKELLAPTRYTGVLASFLGERWWGSGVEHVLWRATEGRSFSPPVLRQLVEELAGRAVEAPVLQYPVLAIDERYEYLVAPLELGDAVEVRPDDWPVFADPAWTTAEIAAGDLGRVVVRRRPVDDTNNR